MYQGDHVLLAACIFFLLSLVAAGSLNNFVGVLRKSALLILGLAIATAFLSAFSHVTASSGEGIRTQYGWPHFFYSSWMSFDRTASYHGFNPIYVTLETLFFGSIWLLFFVVLSRRMGKALQVRFDGWKDPKMAVRFKGSFAYYEAEAAAGRAEPQFPLGVFALRSRDPEIDGIGTPKGARIDVEYDSKLISIEEIRNYLEKLPVKFLF